MGVTTVTCFFAGVVADPAAFGAVLALEGAAAAAAAAKARATAASVAAVSDTLVVFTAAGTGLATGDVSAAVAPAPRGDALRRALAGEVFPVAVGVVAADLTRPCAAAVGVTAGAEAATCVVALAAGLVPQGVRGDGADFDTRERGGTTFAAVVAPLVAVTAASTARIASSTAARLIGLVAIAAMGTVVPAGVADLTAAFTACMAFSKAARVSGLGTDPRARTPAAVVVVVVVVPDAAPAAATLVGDALATIAAAAALAPAVVAADMLTAAAALDGFAAAFVPRGVRGVRKLLAVPLGDVAIAGLLLAGDFVAGGRTEDNVGSGCTGTDVDVRAT